MANKEALNFIDEFKKIWSDYRVDKKSIVETFNKFFDDIGFEKRKIEICENRESWEISVRRKGLLKTKIRDINDWNIVWNYIWNDYKDIKTLQWKIFVNPVETELLEEELEKIIGRNTVELLSEIYKIVTWTEYWDNKGIGWEIGWNIVRWALFNFNCLNFCDKDDNCKVCKFRKKFCIPMLELFKNGAFACWVFNDKVSVIIRPVIKCVDGRFHSVTGPAVKWKNDEDYFLYGVRFNKQLWEKIVNKSMSFQEIMKIKNIEQRMIAFKIMDREKLLREAGARLIDKSPRGNELYIVESLFGKPAYFLKYQCPSTGRVYISGIDPSVASYKPDADFCMAWKLGISPEDYKNIIEA